MGRRAHLGAAVSDRYGSGPELSPARIDEILAALRAIPAPPWAWYGDTRSGPILATTHSGRKYVMGFQRCGMQGAQPTFPVREVSGWALMHPARELIVPRADYDPTTFRDIGNPVASFLKNAPQYVAELLEERNRLARQLADARDETATAREELEKATELCSEHCGERDSAEFTAEELTRKIALTRIALESAKHGPLGEKYLPFLTQLLEQLA